MMFLHFWRFQLFFAFINHIYGLNLLNDDRWLGSVTDNGGETDQTDWQSDRKYHQHYLVEVEQWQGAWR